MDLRFLDWKVWGRTDRLVVQRFESETELHATVVLDLSGDMATGLLRMGACLISKIRRLGTRLCLLQRFYISFVSMGSLLGWTSLAPRPQHAYPPRGGRQQLRRLFAALASVKPGGAADLRDSLIRVGQRSRRRASFSADGMEEPSQWIPTLAAFSKRRADVRFMHIRDSRDWSCSFSQPANFYSPEGGEVLAVDPVAARVAFAAVAQEFQDEIREGVARWGAQYIDTPTDMSLLMPLQKALSVGGLGAREKLR